MPKNDQTGTKKISDRRPDGLKPMSKKTKRISRGTRLYSSMYCDYDTRTHVSANTHTKIQKTIDDMANIRLTRGEMAKQLRQINKLYRDVSSVIDSLGSAHNDDILYIKNNTWEHLCKNVIGFNAYLIKNPIYTMKYKPLKVIKLPERVLLVDTQGCLIPREVEGTVSNVLTHPPLHVEQLTDEDLRL